MFSLLLGRSMICSCLFIMLNFCLPALLLFLLLLLFCAKSLAYFVNFIISLAWTANSRSAEETTVWRGWCWEGEDRWCWWRIIPALSVHLIWILFKFAKDLSQAFQLKCRHEYHKEFSLPFSAFYCTPTVVKDLYRLMCVHMDFIMMTFA